MRKGWLGAHPSFWRMRSLLLLRAWTPSGPGMWFTRKDLRVNHIDGPLGVHARSSNNDLIREKLGWAPSQPLRAGLEDLYRWIEIEVMRHPDIQPLRTGQHKNEPLSAVPGGA